MPWMKSKLAAWAPGTFSPVPLRQRLAAESRTAVAVHHHHPAERDSGRERAASTQGPAAPPTSGTRPIRARPRDETFGPSPYHCGWCGRCCPTDGTTLTPELDADLALPWARERCPAGSCDSEATIASDGTISPRPPLSQSWKWGAR